VDWKVSEPQQPVYVVAPSFGHGLADPFPGADRQILLTKGRTPMVIAEDIPSPEVIEGGKRRKVSRKREKPAAFALGAKLRTPTKSPGIPRAALPLQEFPALEIEIPEFMAIERQAQIARVMRSRDASRIRTKTDRVRVDNSTGKLSPSRPPGCAAG